MDNVLSSKLLTGIHFPWSCSFKGPLYVTFSFSLSDHLTTTVFVFLPKLEVFYQLNPDVFEGEINFSDLMVFCVLGEIVKLIVNLTESRITRKMALWAWHCGIILITLIDVLRPIMTVGRTVPPGLSKKEKAGWALRGAHHSVSWQFIRVTSCLKLLLAWLPHGDGLSLDIEAKRNAFSLELLFWEWGGGLSHLAFHVPSYPSRLSQAMFMGFLPQSIAQNSSSLLGTVNQTRVEEDANSLLLRGWIQCSTNSSFC